MPVRVPLSVSLTSLTPGIPSAENASVTVTTSNLLRLLASPPASCIVAVLPKLPVLYDEPFNVVVRAASV
jgi:hypothetical protein